MAMQREQMIDYLKHSPDIWDIIIIGGGATGLGAAVDAASRGYKTLLIEQCDFAKATSSRSTKLIHGGLRYLKQGNIHLVTEALKERGLLCRNIPHLVTHLAFLVPNYHWWEGPFYGAGLKMYDMLAGELGIEKSMHLSKEETIKRIPTLETEGLRGGTIYYDGQFDDARLAITLALTAVDHGGVVVNYVQVIDLIKEKNKISGVRVIDKETDEIHNIHGKVVINATGIFTDTIRKLDDLKAEKIIAPAQGVHLVLDRSFMPSDTSIMVPHTDDGRVLFMVPWHNRILVGTTDTPVHEPQLEPRPLKEEIAFLLKHAARYLRKDPSQKDVLSAFAGLRPLVKPGGTEKTSKVARDHVIMVSDSNLLTITGGKWTTYRKMAEEVIDKAMELGNLKEYDSITEKLKLHGYLENVSGVDSWSVYGTDASFLTEILDENTEWQKPLHPNLPYLGAEIIWSIRAEMARTVEDVLSRRTRALLLDARASIEIAPKVASMMAEELGKDQKWAAAQTKSYISLAQGYLI